MCRACVFKCCHFDVPYLCGCTDCLNEDCWDETWESEEDEGEDYDGRSETEAAEGL